jgi:hypothetical protein
VHRLPHERRTGRTPHDPAWPSCSHGRATPAPVNGKVCARCRGAGRHAHQSRRNQRYRLCDLARKPVPRLARRILCGSSRQALAHPEAQIPIAHRVRHAGSCMRDFRTPDGTRNPSAISAVEVSFVPSRQRTCGSGGMMSGFDPIRDIDRPFLHADLTTENGRLLMVGLARKLAAEAGRPT